MKKIYAILPCYNEEKNIGGLIEDWKKQEQKLEEKGYKLEIIAIDDKSTDKTKEEILKKKEKYENVEIIEHEENKGLCGGINTGLSYFSKKAKKEDLLALMDGDNTHDPKYIHEMIEKVYEGNTCVIASRYQEGSSITGLSKFRELMSNFAKIYYSMILDIPNVKDYTCGYRIYTYELIEKLLEKFGENPIKEKSFACMVELLYKVHKVGAKFAEVGFVLKYGNKQGESKMNIGNTARRSLSTAIKLKWQFDKTFIISLIFIILFSVFLSLGTNFSPTNKNIQMHDSRHFFICWICHEPRKSHVQRSLG